MMLSTAPPVPPLNKMLNAPPAACTPSNKSLQHGADNVSCQAKWCHHATGATADTNRKASGIDKTPPAVVVMLISVLHNLVMIQLGDDATC